MMLSATAFVADLIEAKAIQFGQFQLKSGLQSPYFMNLGNVAFGSGIDKVGYAFARRISELNFNPDILFGPAYKGIPLATTTSTNLLNFGLDVGVTFNRKEIKQHGEGGALVGADLHSKRVLIIDDVITDGASKIEAAELVRQNGGKPIGVLVALDRKEREPVSGRTYLETVEEKLGLGIYSVATIKDVLAYLELHDHLSDTLDVLQCYVTKHCVLT
ncbi:MAG: orotate phosphoribosyltransferase [Gammaproteobacteria bacterium]|nr:orotate phosphoribosyltransferase [Gammaproteobacteria bacterium]MYC25311.1 orotate phosphoribosyltransferase [Gammaproteobacteria bacterium]